MKTNFVILERQRILRKQLGMTLIEIMVVTLIMALITSGIALGMMNHLENARKESAKREIKTIKTAAKIFQMYNPGECPSLEAMIEDGSIDEETRKVDPWDTPYILDCEDSKLAVSSAGPDQQEGTEDDIR